MPSAALGSLERGSHFVQAVSAAILIVFGGVFLFVYGVVPFLDPPYYDMGQTWGWPL
jgi:hypothetical protein